MGVLSDYMRDGHKAISDVSQKTDLLGPMPLNRVGLDIFFFAPTFRTEKFFLFLTINQNERRLWL